MASSLLKERPWNTNVIFWPPAVTRSWTCCPESMAELRAIDAEFQDRPEVLQLRLHNLMRRQKWVQALRVSQKLCRVAPDCCTGFLHASFCLHELGRTAQAKKLLLTGPPLLLKEPIYYYNMGCYEALLGNVQDARLHLHTSFKMDESFRACVRLTR